MLRLVDLGADGGVRADQHALAALDAELLVPDGDLQSDVALLPHGRRRGERAIHREGGDGERIAVALDDPAEHLADELGRFGGHRRTQILRRGDPARDRHLVQAFQGLVDRGEVLLDNGLAAAPVGLDDRLFDLADGLFARQHAGDGEEARLHDRVDARAHARLAGDRVGVDHVELQLLVDDLLLHGARQVIPDLVRAVGRVQQERASGNGPLEHVDPLQERPLVTGDEVRPGDEVRAAERLGAEAKVADCDRARLLGVIDEIALRPVLGLFANDLDAVLVGAHGAVRPESIKQAADGLVVLGGEIGVVLERRIRHVVDDA